MEVGFSRNARRAFSLDEVAVVPSRRTRHSSEVSIEWKMDAFSFDTPIISSPADSVVSPSTIVELSEFGCLGILDLEGVWTRYENPEPVLREISALPEEKACLGLQKIYSEPIKRHLLERRLQELRDAGVIVAGCLSPQTTNALYKSVISAGVDIFVIRGGTVSAEHVSKSDNVLNLKRFIYELDVPVMVGGVATYTAALHMMRTGAAGVLVGFGGCAGSTNHASLGIKVPMATAIADVAAARKDYLDESGGRYVQVIADGSMNTSGMAVNALALGADAVMMGTPLVRSTTSPGFGYHWGREAHHMTLPRGRRAYIGQTASLQEIIQGPGHSPDGTVNFAGAIRRAVALAGFQDLKNFQRVEMVVIQDQRRCCA
ncbi:GuaB3 family IMP dehydrogenase-related protein [Tropheryma whipplei]|nr:GuaB3 family IMP dehydrogenase-related protein [Tropheryma whipplei]MCO8182697.1 GuaB3 family IMP dehydrogenase-related protein [Tropheryma whipplei]MCO8190393.1 GuaB3 family IMP dehydrogenase-related protein [Tropheryma whipplei]CAD66771.1 putative inosine-5'-monophosphate dehydrogenase [Tropheryma whipplei TW08/27]